MQNIIEFDDFFRIENNTSAVILRDFPKQRIYLNNLFNLYHCPNIFSFDWANIYRFAEISFCSPNGVSLNTKSIFFQAKHLLVFCLKVGFLSRLSTIIEMCEHEQADENVFYEEKLDLRQQMKRLYKIRNCKPIILCIHISSTTS